MKQIPAAILLVASYVLANTFLPGSGLVALAFLPLLPIATALSSIVIPILADKLLPEPKLELADRLANKRRELFNLETSSASQAHVDAAEILGERIQNSARGGAFSSTGDLVEIQGGVNRATDQSFRSAAATLSAGVLSDTEKDEMARFEQAKASRDNSLAAVGSGLGSLAAFSALTSKSNAMKDLLAMGSQAGGNSTALQGLDIMSGINDTSFLNLDFDTSTPNLSGLGVKAKLPSPFPAIDSELDIEKRLRDRMGGGINLS